MANDVLSKYLGQEVVVYYLADSNLSDKGRLVESDDRFVRLERTNADDLLIPIGAIRILALKSHGSTASKKRLPRSASTPVIESLAEGTNESNS